MSDAKAEARKAGRERGIQAALIADADLQAPQQIGRAAANAAIYAYEAALDKAGLVLVPREPTEEMLEAFRKACYGYFDIDLYCPLPEEAYCAMIAAAEPK